MEDHIKKMKDFLTFDIIILVILGLSFGVYFKSIATQNITIGFSDPEAQSQYEVYDIDALEQKLISQGIPQEIVPAQDGALNGVAEVSDESTGNGSL